MPLLRTAIRRIIFWGIPALIALGSTYFQSNFQNPFSDFSGTSKTNASMTITPEDIVSVYDGDTSVIEGVSFKDGIETEIADQIAA